MLLKKYADQIFQLYGLFLKMIHLLNCNAISLYYVIAGLLLLEFNIYTVSKKIFSPATDPLNTSTSQII